MPPARDDDKFMQIDSDSDISLDDEFGKVNKGKGKATDLRRKRDGKRKGKPKDTVCNFSVSFAQSLESHSWPILGKHHTLAPGRRSRKMKLEVSRLL